MDLRVGALPKIRVLPGREASLRTLVERAPEAEAFADRLIEKSRPAMTWFYGVRRKGATIAVMVLAAWLFAHVMFAANGMVVFRQKRAEFKNLQTEIDSLQKKTTHTASRSTPSTATLRQSKRKLAKRCIIPPRESTSTSPLPLYPQHRRIPMPPGNRLFVDNFPHIRVV